MGRRTNWSGNYEYQARGYFEPSSVDELQQLVLNHHRIRAVGTGHSFNEIADASEARISLRRIPTETVIDGDTVTVGSAIRYGDLAATLQDAGRALNNLASLPHISVAGAVATGTHGSGVRVGNLASAVVGLELLRSDGELVTLDPSHPDFAGAVVNVGALGIVTRLSLATEPTYDVAQVVFLGFPWAEVTENFDEIMASAYSVSMFTDWRDAGVQQVWTKSRDGAVAELLGHAPAEGRQHPILGNPADFATEQGGIVGPWNERLAHFRFEFTPSNGDEIQSEYLIGREHAEAAIDALRAVAPKFADHLLVSEIRTIAADELWLSSAYGRDSVAFHFTWKLDQQAVEAAVLVLEEALAPFDARPHWGKVFHHAPPYPRGSDFVGLMERYDVTGKFRSPLLDRALGRELSS
ncbi:FAD-binding protein [Lacisediminihabitans changchengi]|uniref:FAD-binding protein n=1 Tax=Lacisediminihabitans changchengi TaxID=2787634 RepID=A0A934SUU5_9MICO|nr:FAD-binding protein [Lacisediminihabitans changchengi]MBK4348449.1 FAD-binding protein [Lacisediminihabitans changchengi]